MVGSIVGYVDMIDPDDKRKAVKEKAYGDLHNLHRNAPSWYRESLERSRRAALNNIIVGPTEHQYNKIQELKDKGWSVLGGQQRLFLDGRRFDRIGLYLQRGNLIVFVDWHGRIIRVKFPKEGDTIMCDDRMADIWSYTPCGNICIKFQDNFKFEIVSISEIEWENA